MKIGDPITIDAGFVALRDNKVVARAFDDRIGAFVVLEAMRLIAKRDLPCAVYGVTTVQEEIGLRGAHNRQNAMAAAAACLARGIDADAVRCIVMKLRGEGTYYGPEPTREREDQTELSDIPAWGFKLKESTIWASSLEQRVLCYLAQDPQEQV